MPSVCESYRISNFKNWSKNAANRGKIMAVIFGQKLSEMAIVYRNDAAAATKAAAYGQQTHVLKFQCQ